MTALHAHFLSRQQQAFQRLLDTPTRSQSSSQGLSTSGGKSWSSRKTPLSAPCDVNARDAQGRTVLHLAASATDASATEYIRMLLTHPYILVNMPDRESHYTALHRALYHGNLASALVLLQRSDIDVSLKDSEGYTAFDLYNSTVEGTKPPPTAEEAALRAELFTWGANRNAALGHGDSDNRAVPDRVNLEPAQPRAEDTPVEQRFESVSVRQVVMSKLHTGVVTAEPKSNFRACGFGSGGRLGPGQHTQYALVPMSQVTQPVASVALGQDHTLALTASGEVLSWGLNRFSQLGYVLDTPSASTARVEEPIQPVPRKLGSLKGKVVIGVAACKIASACWTASEVYTWGTNNGQLGYDKHAHPVQVLPRVVTRVSQRVLSVSIADSAMACLLESHDVLCLHNDSQFRVTFPAQAFPSEITAYRPPQAIRNASIDKITSCENTFAALSSNGELFTFSLPVPSDSNVSGGAKTRDIVKPQRVWALRKKFSAVKDVALGAEGSIIICTESGHVFIRSRTGGKTVKFQRVPHLQRIVRVCANSTGAFGALRVDADLEPVAIEGHVLSQDLARIQPYLALIADSDQEDAAAEPSVSPSPDYAGLVDIEEREESPSIAKDRQVLTGLCRALLAHSHAYEADKNDGPFADTDDRSDRHGADLLIHVQSESQPKIPAHRVILAVRSPVLAEVLTGRRNVEYKYGNATLKLSLVEQVTAAKTPPLAPWKRLTKLVLNELLALWDWRVSEPLRPLLSSLAVQITKVRADLQAYAAAFDLPHLASALEAHSKREVQPSLSRHLLSYFATSIPSGLAVGNSTGNDRLAADVRLLLADNEVPCHSAVLRARSPFFRSFFDEDQWTVNRWTSSGIISMDFKHMQWENVRFAIMYMYGGDVEIFDTLKSVKSPDELIELMFDVMAVANEWLLERLSLICSSVILRHVTLNNSGSLLAESTHFNTPTLVKRLQSYISRNLETFLESHMLYDLPVDIVRQLSAFIRWMQTDKSPLTRSNRLVQAAMEKNSAWLALQETPEPSSSIGESLMKEKIPKLSPPGPMRLRKSSTSPSASPLMRPQISSSRLNAAAEVSIAEDEMFLMDGVPKLKLASRQSLEDLSHSDKEKEKRKMQKEQDADTTDIGGSPSIRSTLGWKLPAISRYDMRSIMAEAEGSRTPSSKVPGPLPTSRPPLNAVGSASKRQAQPASLTPAPSLSRAPSSSPWKTSPPPTNIASIAVNPSPGQTPPMTPLVRPVRTKTEKPNATPSSSQTAPTANATSPALGPVISPQKRASSKNTDVLSGRRVSSGQSAWTLPPVQPVVQASSSSSGMSFVAIQQLQLEQDATPKKDVRSLKEIQEEEAARQVETDFLRWWAAEEERLKTEEIARSSSKVQKPSKKPRKKDAARNHESRPPQGDNQSDNANDATDKTNVAQQRDSKKDKVKGGRKDGPSTPRKKKSAATAGQQQDVRAAPGTSGSGAS